VKRSEKGEKIMDSNNEIIEILTKIKSDTFLIIEKLEIVREYYRFYKTAAEAYDRAITNFLNENIRTVTK
jgi:hypothetical protein